MTPVFTLVGLPGTFLGPRRFVHIDRMLASMAVALTVTPALALVALGRQAAWAARGSAGSAIAWPLRGDAPARDRGTARDHWHGGARRAGRARRIVAAAASLHAACVDGAGLRSIGWQAPAPPIRRCIASRPGSPASFAPFPACAMSTPTSGGRSQGDQVVGMNSGQLWVNIDPKARLSRHAGRDP